MSVNNSTEQKYLGFSNVNVRLKKKIYEYSSNQNKEVGLNKVTMGSFDMKEFVLWSFISRIGNCRITIS